MAAESARDAERGSRAATPFEITRNANRLLPRGWARRRGIVCAQGEGKDGEGERERERGRAVDPRTFAFLDELWRDHLPELYGYLRRECEVFDRQKADGILAAARLRAIRGYKPKPGHTIDYFKGYFKRTSKAVVIDRKRRFDSKFIRCGEEILAAISDRSASSASPEDLMLEREKRAEMRRLIARLRICLPLLRLGQQTILELRYLEGGDDKPSFEAIGAALGITAGAARMRHDRALKRLAELLLGGG
jgi:RNA polymerase sigma factor (sigma-70 family)